MDTNRPVGVREMTERGRGEIGNKEVGDLGGSQIKDFGTSAQKITVG